MSFDYPSDWEINDTGHVIKVVQNPSNSIRVTQYANKADYIEDMEYWEDYLDVSGVQSLSSDNRTYTNYTVKDKYYLRYCFLQKNGSYYMVGGQVSEELDKIVDSIR